MKFKDAKIQDFAKKMKDITIILGHNGSGKTSYLKSLFAPLATSPQGKQSLFISDSYIINSGQIIRYFIDNTDIDSLESKAIKEKQLQHLNTMIHNNYTNLEYTIVDYDSFTEIFGEGSSEVELLFDEYSKGLQFFYIKVTDAKGKEYTSLDMGRGEYLSIAYFILFSEEVKDKRIFIDEPCNYLSYFSLQNFVKLLIVSSGNEKNEFYLTTNNLDIIDILENYSVEPKIIFNYPESPKKISKQDYQEVFCERYEIGRLERNIIFVEDVLARKFVSKLFPENHVIHLDGEGSLALVEKFIDLIGPRSDYIGNQQLKKMKIIYDGNNRDKENKLPFEDIESYLNSNFENFVDGPISKSKKYKIELNISQLEKHDAYRKNLKQLDITEEQCIDYLVSKFKDGEWYEHISRYLHS